MALDLHLLQCGGDGGRPYDLMATESSASRSRGPVGVIRSARPSMLKAGIPGRMRHCGYDELSPLEPQSLPCTPLEQGGHDVRGEAGIDEKSAGTSFYDGMNGSSPASAGTADPGATGATDDDDAISRTLGVYGLP